jgi:hypothetical protein
MRSRNRTDGVAAALAIVIAGSLAIGSAGATEDGPGGLFDASADGGVLLLVGEPERDALAASLEDAGRNWPSLAGALRALDGEMRDACAYLIAGMPHLDRLEMTTEALVEHVEYAYRARSEMPYGVPGEMFRPYILTYRIEEEPVDPWRKELFERFSQAALDAGAVDGTARAINEAIAAAVVEREREFFGPRQSPLMTLRSGRGTGTEVSILACAALKAVGIPSRQASVAALGAEDGGASWIEFYDGERWLPLYPLAPEAFGDSSYLEREYWDNVTVVSTSSAFERILVTEGYTETGTIDLTFASGGEPAAGYEHFSISVLNEGALVPLDALEAVADDEGRFVATVGDGQYVVQAGTRDADGNAFVMMRHVIVAPGATKPLGFDVSPGDRGLRITPELKRRFEFALRAWVAFDLETEPSIRMLPLIASAFLRAGPIVEVTYTYMGEHPERAEEARPTLGPLAKIRVVRGSEDWYYVGDGGAHARIKNGGADTPVVRLFGPSGRLLFHSEGYDLNIEREISIAIEGFMRETIGN